MRNWSSTWVGLDLMEITGLVLTAVTVWAVRNTSLPKAGQQRDR